VPLGTASAHLVSPAILALDAAGRLGVKTVGTGDKVAFNTVEIIRSAEDGVWIGGLPPNSQVITVGQGFVQAGEQVRTAKFEKTPSAPREPTIGTTSQAVAAAGARQPSMPPAAQRARATPEPPSCDELQTRMVVASRSVERSSISDPVKEKAGIGQARDSP